jgi:sterol desaturase/sphingolipid hydroxylase (fatty acid hydroxylase superfamily)
LEGSDFGGPQHAFNLKLPTMMLLVEGFLLSSFGVLLMLVFEFGLSSTDIKKIREREGGKELHDAGIRATVINHLIMGPITYVPTVLYCCVNDVLTLSQQAFAVLNFLVIESALYYCAHYLMHTRRLYWMHRFHHKFNVIVLPSSASAVSTPEFMFAYMAPFLVAAWGGSCDKASAVVAVMLVMFFNLVIHTPSLEAHFERYPWMLVSPGDHLAHHRQLSCHYSAPIFHFDRMILSLKECFTFVTGGKRDEGHTKSL